MTEEKKKHTPGEPHNPGFVRTELCEAFRETILTKIDGIKHTIIVGLSISTAIITIAMYLMSLGGS